MHFYILTEFGAGLREERTGIIIFCSMLLVVRTSLYKGNSCLDTIHVFLDSISLYSRVPAFGQMQFARLWGFLKTQIGSLPSRKQTQKRHYLPPSPLPPSLPGALKTISLETVCSGIKKVMFFKLPKNVWKKIYLCYKENTNSICQTLIKWATVLVGLLMSQTCKTALTGSLSALFILQGISARSRALHRTFAISIIPTHFLVWTLAHLSSCTLGQGKEQEDLQMDGTVQGVQGTHSLLVAREENVYSSILVGLSVSHTHVSSSVTRC